MKSTTARTKEDGSREKIFFFRFFSALIGGSICFFRTLPHPPSIRTCKSDTLSTGDPNGALPSSRVCLRPEEVPGRTVLLLSWLGSGHRRVAPRNRHSCS